MNHPLARWFIYLFIFHFWSLKILKKMKKHKIIPQKMYVWVLCVYDSVLFVLLLLLLVLLCVLTLNFYHTLDNILKAGTCVFAFRDVGKLLCSSFMETFGWHRPMNCRVNSSCDSFDSIAKFFGLYGVRGLKRSCGAGHKSLSLARRCIYIISVKFGDFYEWCCTLVPGYSVSKEPELAHVLFQYWFIVLNYPYECFDNVPWNVNK